VGGGREKKGKTVSDVRRGGGGRGLACLDPLEKVFRTVKGRRRGGRSEGREKGVPFEQGDWGRNKKFT